jgi:uncharacterized membrane protein
MPATNPRFPRLLRVLFLIVDIGFICPLFYLPRLMRENDA